MPDIPKHDVADPSLDCAKLHLLVQSVLPERQIGFLPNRRQHQIGPFARQPPVRLEPIAFQSLDADLLLP